MNNIEPIVDHITVAEKKTKNQWPLDYTSTKGLWPYIKRLKGDVVGIEIGTSCAESTYLLLEMCPNIKKLYTIDPYMEFKDWCGTITQENINRQEEVAKQNLAEFGDRVEMIKSTSTDAAKKFTPDSVDFIFIDGNHEYTAVLKDCETYYPFLKKGGFFCGHDYSFLPDVKQAVQDFRKKHNIKEPLVPTLNTAFYWYKK